MWNGPINGDWSTVKFDEAPWNNEICTLTHEEVVSVIDALPPLEAEYLPSTDMVISKFNALTSWEKCINGITYNCIKGYNPEVNTLGLDASGIVVPVVEEQPTEEVTPVEGV